MSTRNFFGQMQVCCSDANSLKSNGGLSKEQSFCILAFEKLVAFVESGVLYKGDFKKFMSKNWFLSSVKLTSVWNNQTGDSKSSDTVRGQVLTASKKLELIFGKNLDSNLFSNMSDSCFEFWKSVEAKVLALSDYLVSDYDIMANNIFIKDAVSYVSLEDFETYSLEECENEIKLLGSLLSSRLYDVFDEYNLSKLAFLFNTINQPLFGKTKRGTREISFNQDKLALLLKLHKVDYKPLTELCKDLGVSDDFLERDEVKNLRGSSCSSTGSSDNFGYNINSLKDIILELELKASSNDTVTGFEDDRNKRKNEWLRLLSPKHFKASLKNLSSDDAKAILKMLK